MTLEIRREPDLFEARGKVAGGSIPAEVKPRLEGYARRVVELETLDAASPAAKDALIPLFELALVLYSGRVEVTPKSVLVEGKTRTQADRAQARKLVGVAAGMLSLEVADDLTVDATVFDAHEGFVGYTDDSAITGLELRVDEASPAIMPDDAGRMPEGIYRIGKTSQYVAVAPGRTTWLRPGAPEGGILIGGRRFALDTDVKVVAPGDPGALDFAAAKAPDEMPMFGVRYAAPGKRIEPAEIFAHRDFVHQAVLHFDLNADSAAAFAELVKDSLSTHFMIDWDGTIYQGLDVAAAAYHAGEANNAGVGIHLNNLAADLETHPKASPWPKAHPRLAEMLTPAFERKVSSRAEINGAVVRSYGYTEAQYRALGSLLRALAAAFPKLARGPPVDPKGNVMLRVLDDPARHDGVMAHFHVEADRWDPGPAFDWGRLGLDARPGR